LRDTKGEFREEPNTEFYNGIICPGFINAHCHIELSHMRGMINEGIGLDNFIYSVVTSRKSEKQEIEEAIIKADQEMKQEGIVAVGDISNRTDSFKIKSASKILYHSFIEIFNMSNNEAEKCYKEGVRVLETAKKDYQLSASLVPHASYSVSEKLFEYFRQNQNNDSDILSVHNQETIFENEFISDKKGRLLDIFLKLGMEKGDSKPRGMNSLKYLLESLPGNNPLLLVHNTQTGAGDIEDIKSHLTRIHFCLCPNSNLYISKELPGSYLADNFPEKICIGTDSLSSNHRLSILEEIKTLQNHFHHKSLAEILSYATINGARALKLENQLGSFEKGKTPGVNLIEKADLQNLILNRNSKIRVLV
jgi:cytosine/adenosine deaminase-related metal-dependent hydrolase